MFLGIMLFIALIDKYSEELGVKYILNGYNIATEIVADPTSWVKGGGPTGDGTYVKDVIRKYCRTLIRHYTFTNGFKHKFWIPYVKGVKTIKPLNLVPVTRKQMMEVLSQEYGYEPYRQKHFEDLLTKFLEGWWSPTRFGHDMRRPQLSSLVVTGQITREEALKILEQPPLRGRRNGVIPGGGKASGNQRRRSLEAASVARVYREIQKSRRYTLWEFVCMRCWGLRKGFDGNGVKREKYVYSCINCNGCL